VNIRMIVFERSDDQIVRVVVKKLRAAVPERRFVLVPFEDHFRPVAEAVTLAEVFRHSANQERRALSRYMKNPRQHRRRRCLSVRSTDHDRVLPGKKNLLEDFRHRPVRNLAVECFLQLGIAAPNDVPDDDQIGSGMQVRGIERVEECNPQRFEQSGCGRINSGIGSRYPIAVLAQHTGERRHRRTSDANHVDMLLFDHAVTAGSRISRAPSPSACSLARTPRGTVTMGRGVWPKAAPKTIGTPRGTRIRSQTSRTEGLPGTGGSHSGNSPNTIPRKFLNLPACFRCISARSTW